MEKKLLKSDEEYFKYCVENHIGHIQRIYYTQCCDIESECSESCDFWGKVDGESLHVSRKPSSYPCVMTWLCVGGDYEVYYAEFVYEKDFIPASPCYTCDLKLQMQGNELACPYFEGCERIKKYNESVKKWQQKKTDLI